jgi:hypothetical protein
LSIKNEQVLKRAYTSASPAAKSASVGDASGLLLPRGISVSSGSRSVLL